MHGLQEKRNTADMVFMTMSDNHCLDLLLVLDQVGIIGNDVINAEQAFFREQNAAVDNDDFIIVFDAVHVLANLAESA